MRLGLLTLILLQQACSHQRAQPVAEGAWRVVLASPGGDLPFMLTLTRQGSTYKATVHNGAEVIVLDRFEVDAQGALNFGIEHYETYFSGQLGANGTTMAGTWTKVIGLNKKAELPFSAQHGVTERFPTTSGQTPVDVSGTWSVSFDNHGNPQPSVAVFNQEGNKLWGTFLTTTGDYRYLAGVVDGSRLALSCFDGGHAFLFTASLDAQQQLVGDFWSRDSWHESWSARRDPDAALPDSYQLTSLKAGLEQFHFNFPNLEGRMVAHDDANLLGKVRLISIFGSWCPNCNDEAPFLQELKQEYGSRGLEVLGLAFEMTGDKERDLRILKRFQKRHAVDYTILLAGGSTDKQKAAEALPGLDKLLSFPTTILVDRRGNVVSIHTGFSGPGTGPYYDMERERYRKKIEALL